VTVSREEAQKWLQEWPVGSRGVLYFSRRDPAVGVEVVSHERAGRGWPRLRLKGEGGQTYYCLYGNRRSLTRPDG